MGMKRRSIKKVPNAREALDFISEFNPTAFELERVARIIDRILEYQAISHNLANINVKRMVDWLASLRVLWSIIRPLVNDETKRKKDRQFNKAYTIIYDLKKYKTTEGLLEIFKFMSTLTDDMLYLRQVVGLGLFVSENRELAEKDLRARLI